MQKLAARVLDLNSDIKEANNEIKELTTQINTLKGAQNVAPAITSENASNASTLSRQGVFAQENSPNNGENCTRTAFSYNIN